jgi:hypothetical protein
LPDVKRKGSDITILTVGAALYAGLHAAALLEGRGLSAEVIDARSLVPFDYHVLIESVKKTGRLVLVSDACERGSFLNDIARNLTEFAFDYLDAPPVVVGAPNVISPVRNWRIGIIRRPNGYWMQSTRKFCRLKAMFRRSPSEPSRKSGAPNRAYDLADMVWNESKYTVRRDA